MKKRIAVLFPVFLMLFAVMGCGPTLERMLRKPSITFKNADKW